MADEGIASRPSETVRVALGERSYDILIGRGMLAAAGAEIAARLPGARAAVVTDENVARHHLAELTSSLSAAAIDYMTITVPAGEESKSFERLTKVLDTLLIARIERRDMIIGLGGGVVGDLAGFASAILRRGTHMVQIPTTLLAQVDSSVGGKTGINTPRGKNLVGAFHQPRLVLADTGVLDSLPPRMYSAGYAEVVKVGLIGDAAFFAWLETNWRAMAAGWSERDQAIAHACRFKADTVAADEREDGQRALLNLGHTFGHALEGATGYSDRLLHGEAVAIGIVLAHEFSTRIGLCPPGDVERIVRHFRDVGLPTRIADIPGAPMSTEMLMGLIGQDKKVSRGALTFILTRGIGEAFVAKDVPPEQIAGFIAEKVSQ